MIDPGANLHGDQPGIGSRTLPGYYWHLYMQTGKEEEKAATTLHSPAKNVSPSRPVESRQFDWVSSAASRRRPSRVSLHSFNARNDALKLGSLVSPLAAEDRCFLGVVKAGRVWKLSGHRSRAARPQQWWWTNTNTDCPGELDTRIDVAVAAWFGESAVRVGSCTYYI